MKYWLSTSYTAADGKRNSIAYYFEHYLLPCVHWKRKGVSKQYVSLVESNKNFYRIYVFTQNKRVLYIFYCHIKSFYIISKWDTISRTHKHSITKMHEHLQVFLSPSLFLHQQPFFMFLIPFRLLIDPKQFDTPYYVSNFRITYCPYFSYLFARKYMHLSITRFVSYVHGLNSKKYLRVIQDVFSFPH